MSDTLSNVMDVDVLLGATTGTGTKTLAYDYRNYRAIVLIGLAGNDMFPAFIPAKNGGLLTAGYSLCVHDASNGVFRITMTSPTTVNIQSNPSNVRIWGVK